VKLLEVEGHARRLSDGWEADLRVMLPRRWWRVGVFYGPPPGSHMGWWLTGGDGLWGINYRRQVSSGPGRWRCLTLLAHTRDRADELAIKAAIRAGQAR
jgi:hypothetical protein